MKNWKQKLQYAGAVVVTTALPAIAMAADDVSLFDGAKAELSSLKSGIVAVGIVGIGLAIAGVSIGIVKYAIRKSA